MKPLVIEPDVLEKLARLSKRQKADCWLAIAELPEVFGRPHVHSGLGIRKMRPRLYEFRAGLDLRLIFREESNALYIGFIGNHDEVRKAMRSGKFN